MGNFIFHIFSGWKFSFSEFFTRTIFGILLQNCLDYFRNYQVVKFITFFDFIHLLKIRITEFCLILVFRKMLGSFAKKDQTPPKIAIWQFFFLQLIEKNHKKIEENIVDEKFS